MGLFYLIFSVSYNEPEDHFSLHGCQKVLVLHSMMAECHGTIKCHPIFIKSAAADLGHKRDLDSEVMACVE